MGEYPTSGIERDPARATDETIVIPGHGPIGNKSQLIIFGNARGGTPLMQFSSDGRDRFAVENSRLAGRRRPNMDFI
jgi:hypothetical protein